MPCSDDADRGLLYKRGEDAMNSCCDITAIQSEMVFSPPNAFVGLNIYYTSTRQPVTPSNITAVRLPAFFTVELVALKYWALPIPGLINKKT